MATGPAGLRAVTLSLQDCRVYLDRMVPFYGPDARPDSKLNCLWHAVLYLSRAVESLAGEVAEPLSRPADHPVPPADKPVHMAAKVALDGRVSPLCAARPRAINLRRATWTLRPGAVTCPRCLVALKESSDAAR